MPARHACGMNAMLLSPARMYAHLLRHDLSAFIHRSFLELNPQTQFHSNWHNNQETGAIIIVMQRLHADDLVAHVQESERWDVLSFPVIAEQDEPYSFQTPYGRRRVHRRAGEILQPALFSAVSLEVQRRGMTDYNFVAQYQQNPQPQSGIIVKREWLKFYSSDEK